MSAIGQLRLVVMMRRLERAVNRLCDIEQAKLDYMVAKDKKPKNPKLAELGRASIEDLNRNYIEKHGYPE